MYRADLTELYNRYQLPYFLTGVKRYGLSIEAEPIYGFFSYECKGLNQILEQATA
jgi:hypothetical protein